MTPTPHTALLNGVAWLAFGIRELGVHLSIKVVAWLAIAAGASLILDYLVETS